jgi:ferrochelatase
MVRFAMCYSNPSVADVLKEMETAGVEDLTVIPLYPQYSTTTIGSVFDQVMTFYMHAMSQPKLHFIDSFYQSPAYIQLLAKQIKDALKEHPNAHLVFHIMVFHKSMLIMGIHIQNNVLRLPKK